MRALPKHHKQTFSAHQLVTWDSAIVPARVSIVGALRSSSRRRGARPILLFLREAPWGTGSSDGL